MKLRGAVGLDGQFTIVHKNKDGEILCEETVHNTTTNTGFAEIAGLINESTSIGFKWLALDSSSTTAAAAPAT